MREITAKRYRKKVKEFIPIAEYLRAEGRTDIEIWKTFQNYVHFGLTGNFLTSKRDPFSSNIWNETNNWINTQLHSFTFDDFEMEFEDKLAKAVPEYQIDYKIGDYRVQYLIHGWLVVEITGQPRLRHKKPDKKIENKEKYIYLKSMGYKVLDIPEWIFELSVDAVIDEIKELL